MDQDDVYLYGMVLLTTSTLLESDFPKAGGYGECRQRYRLSGGETGTCATVLANLGCHVRMDGNHLGRETYPKLAAMYRDLDVDISAMTYDPSFEGLEDHVFIDPVHRTVFGSFGAFFAAGQPRRWNMPKKEAIAQARVVGLDPFFGAESEQVATFCHELQTPYVTIDCRHDSVLHQYAAVNVLSGEYLENNYGSLDRNALWETYAEQTDGLVIFTFGANELLYGRKGQPPTRFKPYQVDVVSTLGAGDSFKAGAVYALIHGMDDEALVQFASATAACACTRFPIPLFPPSLEAIQAIQSGAGSPRLLLTPTIPH